MTVLGLGTPEENCAVPGVITWTFEYDLVLK